MQQRHDEALGLTVLWLLLSWNSCAFLTLRLAVTVITRLEKSPWENKPRPSACWFSHAGHRQQSWPHLDERGLPQPEGDVHLAVGVLGDGAAEGGAVQVLTVLRNKSQRLPANQCPLTQLSGFWASLPNDISWCVGAAHSPAGSR